MPLDRDTRRIKWPQYDRRVEVAQFICVFCAGADLIKRDWHAAHEKDTTQTGVAAPGDGRMFVARPPTDEE